jgi:hypothetical protein
VVLLVRIAGVLLLTGSLFFVPGGAVLEPAPPLTDYLVSAAGVLIASEGRGGCRRRLITVALLGRWSTTIRSKSSCTTSSSSGRCC